MFLCYSIFSRSTYFTIGRQHFKHPQHDQQVMERGRFQVGNRSSWLGKHVVRVLLCMYVMCVMYVMYVMCVMYVMYVTCVMYVCMSCV